MRKRIEGNPPANTLNADKWDHFPDMEEPAKYRIKMDGKRNRIVTIKGKRRRVFEALRTRPVTSASRARVSDKVLHLRSLIGQDSIETVDYSNDQNEWYGIYFIRCFVEYIGDVAPKTKRGAK